MKRTILLLLMVLTALTSRAQRLEECCRLAREHYPEIRQYDLIAETEQYNISNAARAWIPQVVLSGQATYQSATPTYPEAFNQMKRGHIFYNEALKDNTDMQVGIEQTLALERGSRVHDDAPDADEGAIWTLQRSTRQETFQPIFASRPKPKNAW